MYPHKPVNARMWLDFHWRLDDALARAYLCQPLREELTKDIWVKLAKVIWHQLEDHVASDIRGFYDEK